MIEIHEKGCVWTLNFSTIIASEIGIQIEERPK